jgi:hypothetical protein
MPLDMPSTFHRNPVLRFRIWPILALPLWATLAAGSSLFTDRFDSVAPGGPPDPRTGWEVFGLAEGRVAEVVGSGDALPWLRLESDGGGVMQVLNRNAWPAASATVITVAFDFVEFPGYPGGRVSLRVGRQRAFSSDRVHEVRLEQGSINGQPHAYRPGFRHRIHAVFNNSPLAIANYHNGLDLAPDSVDVWIDGERVLAGTRYLRGGLPLEEPLEAFTLDLPSGLRTGLGIDNVRVHRGAFIEPAAAVNGVAYEEWIGAFGLPLELTDADDCPAGDGVPNLMKFFGGLDPLSPARNPGMLELVVDPADSWLSFAMRPGLAGVRPRLLQSPNLDSWDPVPSHPVPDTGCDPWRRQYRAPVRPTERSVFYRLTVETMDTSRPSADLYREFFLELDEGIVVLPDPRFDSGAVADGKLIVAPPGKRLTEAERSGLDAFRRNGGAVLLLDPLSMDYRPRIRDQIMVFDPGSTPYNLIKPTQSQVNGAAEISTRLKDAPDPIGKGLEVTTRLIGDGDVFVELSLSGTRAAERSVLRFFAWGEFDVDIIFVSIDDTAGKRWLTFRRLEPGWNEIVLSMADLLRDGGSGEPGVSGLHPEAADKLRIGMARYALWPEVGGTFALGPVFLGGEAGGNYIPSGELTEWRLQSGRYKVNVPSEFQDPWHHGQSRSGDALHPALDRDQVLARPLGTLMAVPPPAPERGREDTELRDVLARDRYFRRPVLEARDRGGVSAGPVAEIRYFNGGPYSGGVLGLFGWVPDSPWTAPAFAGSLAEVVDRLKSRPQIVDIEARGPTLSGDAGARLSVTVANPSENFFFGSLSASVNGDELTGLRDAFVPAGGRVTLEVGLGHVPETFSFRRFDWQVQLRAADGELLDEHRDAVDVERLMAHACAYFLSLQEQHRDARMCHHFFTDIYAARFLVAYGEFLEDHGRLEIVADILDELTPAQVRSAGLAFADHIADSQSADGSFPMGYGEHRGIRWTADLGQIAFGLLQLASRLDAGDPRRERYRDVGRGYFSFRESFYIDAAKAAELEAIHGPDPNSIQAGFYGMGLMDSDYFSGERWPELRREERGRYWIVPLSMVGMGILAVEDGIPAYSEVAQRDIRFYLDNDYALGKATYFHSEALLWMYYLLDDPEIRQRITSKAPEFLPATLSGNPGDGFDYQGRAVIRLLTLLYYDRYFEASPRHRAQFLQALVNMDLDGASFSLREIASKYPRTSYGPSIAAHRYHAFAALWMLELMEEGLTLLKGRPFPSN